MSVPSVSERERRFTAVAAEWQRLVLDARRPDETRFAAVKREADAIIDAGQWVSGPADMLSVIGRQRDELVHSRVIGWLLTPTGRHGLGRSFLRALLDHVWPGEASLRAECGQRISFKDHLLPRRRRLPGRPLQPGPQAGTGRWVTSAAVYSVDTSALIDGLERYGSGRRDEGCRAVTRRRRPVDLTLGLVPEDAPRPVERVEVEPEVLLWARRSIGLDVVGAAKKIGVVPRTVERWESGELAPTIKQLRKAAAAYKRPLAVLLLPEPAKDFDALRDFRAGPEHVGAHLSPVLTAEYWRAMSQREVLVEIGDLGGLAPTEAREPLRITMDTPVEEAGEGIRAWLGIVPTAWPQPRAALASWIAAAEEQDILVVQTQRVSMREMRGFSITQLPYPVVALNGKDSTRGRLFTLAHELAHLGLNAGGLCDLDERRRGDASEDRVERFCNRAAAAALMPRDALMDVSSVARASRSTRWTVDELGSLSEPFGTSAESLLLRLVSLERADWDLYRALKPAFDALYKAAETTRERGSGGPSYYVLKARDLGHLLRARLPRHLAERCQSHRGRAVLHLRRGLGGGPQAR